MFEGLGFRALVIRQKFMGDRKWKMIAIRMDPMLLAVVRGREWSILYSILLYLHTFAKMKLCKHIVGLMFHV